MANSAIETELVKAAGLKTKKNEEVNAYLHRLVDAVQDLDDDVWKGLSTEAQNWVNECATEIKKDGEDAELPNFPDLEDDEDESEAEDETEADEESDEEGEEEDQEDEPGDEDEPDDEEEGTEEDEEESDVDDEDEKPAKKSAAKKAAPTKKVAAKNGADPKKKIVAKPDKKSEKKAAPKAEKKAPSGPKASGIKVKIKRIVFKNPSITPDDLMERLGKDGVKPSKLTVSAIRSEFRHSLWVLKELDALKVEPKL
jgi:hypothetical protein